MIGVLGLQGAVREHVLSLNRLGVETRVVKRTTDLERLDGLVFPGGESTTIAHLAAGEMFARFREMAASGFPMFGTCAGMILLARTVEGNRVATIGAIDITVARNASGRQVDSFETCLEVDTIGADVPAVFIRAPYITHTGSDVVPMAIHEGSVVMARQGRVLVTSFHPELTDDLRVHRYFVETMVTL